jgi:hypothetical protein
MKTRARHGQAFAALSNGPAAREAAFDRHRSRERRARTETKGGHRMSILWIILIVVLVLALLGFFTRGYW